MASIISAGTTTGTALNLTGDTSGELQIKTNNGSTTALTLTTGGAATFTAGTVSAPAITTTGDTNTGIFFPAADTIAFTEDGAESMRIDSSGNVGIGTTSPSFAVDVVRSGGNAQLRLMSQATGTNGIIFRNNAVPTSAKGAILYPNGSAVGGDTMQFVVDAAERMRIDINGNLLVGRSDNPSGATGCLYATNNYNLTTASAANVFINSEGLFFRSTSSLKYKQDIQDATHGLAEVLQLRPVTYKGKSELDGDTIFGGLIAEEVHEAGLTEFVQYAEDGSPDALAYGNMVSLAFKAIQELNAKVDAQALEIATLKAK